MTNDAMIINAFVFYIGLMMAIGVYYYRQTKNMSDYFLGNRRLGAWVTSLSAEASDMSGWMLMGLKRGLDSRRNCNRHLGELALRSRAFASIYRTCRQRLNIAGIFAESLQR